MTSPIEEFLMWLEEQGKAEWINYGGGAYMVNSTRVEVWQECLAKAREMLGEVKSK